MKTKTKKKLKHVKHVITRKKLVKKQTSQRLLRAAFAVIVVASTGSLALAIAGTKPPELELKFERQIKPLTPLINVPADAPPDQVGQASWYALGLRSPDALTCASTRYPRGTYLQVKNRRNGRIVTCLVNDYGPEAWTMRAIDLSRGSFTQIDSLSSGTAPVEIRVVPPPPTGINLLMPNVFSQITGYRLCSQKHSFIWCESNRQSTQKLR